jgi:hypothetical protein
MQFSAQTCPIRIGFDRYRRPEIIFAHLASKENGLRAPQAPIHKRRRKTQNQSPAGRQIEAKISLLNLLII